jgi:Cupredoxin-like domain
MNRRFSYGIWLVSLFLVVAACCCVARAEDVFNASITIRGHKFEPPELHVPAGKRIFLTVINTDPLSEEFDSPALKAEKVIAGSSEGIIRIAPLKPGTYEFVGEYHEETAKGRLIAE